MLRPDLSRIFFPSAKYPSISHDFFSIYSRHRTYAKRTKKLRTVHLFILGIGMIMSFIEIISITLWAVTGNWIPFAVGMPIVILLGCLLTALYYQSIAFICPTCSTGFKPTFKEFFFAMHTPKATNLTCPQCRKKNWCIEIYHINNKTNWKKEDAKWHPLSYQ